MQWSRISNLFISILGIIASIIGLAIMSDWQAIRHDPCLDYSLYHRPELANNISLLNLDSYSPTATCWNMTNSYFLNPSDAKMIQGHLVLYYNPFVYRDTELNCRLHASKTVCYVCRNSSVNSSHVEMNFKNTGSEICYNPMATPWRKEALKLSIVCDGSQSPHCMSACLHIQEDPQEATVWDLAESSKKLFHHTYKHSMLLLQRFVYDAARNKCESTTENKCHWIPDSLITHKTCTDCQPICRGLSRTMSFVQFVAGSVWFMLTYPVAEVALPVVISDSIEKEFQVLY